MWRACSTPAPASNKFCIFTKVLHLSEVHRKSELSHLSEVRSRQSITSNNIYFSSVFIHIVAYYRSVLFVVALLRQRLQPTSTPRVCMFIFWAKQRLQRRSFYMPFSLPTYARTVFHVSLHNQVRGHAIFEVVLTNQQPPASHHFIHHPREMTSTILPRTI